jgi:hypothetical protein
MNATEGHSTGKKTHHKPELEDSILATSRRCHLSTNYNDPTNPH